MGVNTINVFFIAICIVLALPSVIVTVTFYVIDQHEPPPPPPPYEPETGNWTCYQPLPFGVRQKIYDIGKIVTTVIGAMGIIGNLLTLMVLRRREMTTFNQLLFALCIEDLTFIFGKVLFDVTYLLVYKDTYFDCWPSVLRGIYLFFLLPIYRVSFTASIWTVVALATERYLGICRPFQHRPGIWFYLVLILCLSVALNIGTSLEYNLDLTFSGMHLDARYGQFWAYWVQITVLGIFSAGGIGVPEWQNLRYHQSFREVSTKCGCCKWLK